MKCERRLAAGIHLWETQTNRAPGCYPLNLSISSDCNVLRVCLEEGASHPVWLKRSPTNQSAKRRSDQNDPNVWIRHNEWAASAKPSWIIRQRKASEKKIVKIKCAAPFAVLSGSQTRAELPDDFTNTQEITDSWFNRRWAGNLAPLKSLISPRQAATPRGDNRVGKQRRGSLLQPARTHPSLQKQAALIRRWRRINSRNKTEQEEGKMKYDANSCTRNDNNRYSV